MASGGGGLETCMIEFSLDLYRQIVAENPAANAFLSPSSILVVMAMVHMGAGGKTLEQMTKVLKFEHFGKTDPKVALGKFISELKKENNNFLLKTANRLFPHVDKTILDQYIKDVTKHFSADTKSMDYTTQAEAARLEINSWVEQETDNKIKELLAPGMLNSLTAMVLVNAIYFKGDWATQFDKSATRPDNFYTSETNSVQVPMMYKKIKNIGYKRDDNLACSVLELPYKGEELSMILILPNQRAGLSTLESRLTGQIFQGLTSMFRKSTVEVHLPKFKLETSYQLNKILNTLGMTDAFDPKLADFSGMSDKEALFVSHVVHKAFVNVNEEGTEAAAATAAMMMKRSIQITPEFRADHPFLFVIYDKRQKVPLFMGRVVSPTGSDAMQQKEEL